MSEEKKTVIQTIAGLTSLTERINEICGRTQITNCSAIQTALKSSELWASAIKPKDSVIDVVLQGSALSAALAAPSKWTLNPLEGIAPALPSISKCLLTPNITALAAMEAKM